jgi:hydroxypyruvate isomerase
MRYSAHLDTLYAQLPPEQRPARAAEDGFTCVELWAPQPAARSGISRELAGHELDVACVNTHPGPYSDDFGQLGNPDALAWWREDFLETLDFARGIGAGAINVLAGGRLSAAHRDGQMRTVRDNLTWALGRLGAGDPVLLLEPLNSADRRSPLLGSVCDVLRLSGELGEPEQLRLLFDAYHLYQEERSLLSALRVAGPKIGHIQIADWPGRGEPGTGRIPFAELLAEVDRIGYRGWIGLEYFPTSGPPVVPPLSAVIGMTNSPGRQS